MLQFLTIPKIIQYYNRLVLLDCWVESGSGSRFDAEYLLEVLNTISATNFLIEITERYDLVADLVQDFENVHAIVSESYEYMDKTRRRCRSPQHQLPYKDTSLYLVPMLVLAAQVLLQVAAKRLLFLLDEL